MRGLSAVRIPLCLPECRAPAVGHWLPSAPWRILLDGRCLSHRCCTVGCPKHDGAVAPNLNIRHEGREEHSHGETGCSVMLLL